MGKIRASCDPDIHWPIDKSSFDCPIFSEILVDDIAKVLVIQLKHPAMFDIISFDTIDELKRSAVLASARGIQLRGKFENTNKK